MRFAVTGTNFTRFVWQLFPREPGNLIVRLLPAFRLRYFPVSDSPALSSPPVVVMATSTHCCLVCAVPIRETHLGINACRACALFFKRTRRTRRAYTCRRGTGKCVFRKHEPFACKKCRYERCIAIGMENSSEMTVEESLLDRLKEEYELSYKRRIDAERRLAEIHNLPRANTVEELYQTTAAFYYDTYPVWIRELIALLTCVIPEFEDFEDDLKLNVLKNLLGKFYALNTYYRTSRAYLKTGKCISTALSCFDIDNSDQWISEQEVMTRKEQQRNGDGYRSSLQAHASDFLALMYKMLRTDDITDREYYGLIAITFCELDTQLPDKIQHLFDNARATALNELQRYYREQLKLADYSARLGSLMSLTAAMAEIHVISADQHRLYTTLFDIKSEDAILADGIASYNSIKSEGSE